MPPFMPKRRIYNLDIIEIHGKDLIANHDPKGTLLRLCNHVRANCSNITTILGYLQQ